MEAEAQALETGIASASKNEEKIRIRLDKKTNNKGLQADLRARNEELNQIWKVRWNVLQNTLI